MKNLISVLLLVTFLSTLLFSDTIYLKNGKILKGKITEADTETVTIETETEWFKIHREDIEKIKLDKKVVEKIIPEEISEEKEEKKGDTYYQGKKDGEIAGGAENQMIAGGGCGCLLGPIGYLFIPMAGGEPLPEKMQSIKEKSEEYKQGYRDGYKGKKKSQFITGVSIGWAAWLATVLVVTMSGSGE